MLFNSVSFLIFFPVVTLVYFLIPQRFRHIWLLLASYFFYMSWNPRYAFLIVAVTLITWVSGLLLSGWGKERGRGRLCLAAGIIVSLGILFFFKYYDFAVNTVTALLSVVRVTVRLPAFDILLPVGISFYTFQAMGYVIDVYRGKVKAEKNLLRYALFISFFPQLVAGPIERSGNLLSQVWEEHHFDWDRVRDGLLLMGWGFFQKVVIADRIAILVTDVYDNYTEYTGLQILIATVLFAFQIYCDFAGYSDIAIGAARVMGFRLMKNFNSPYYSTSVGEFWRLWHISLTTWFRDYIYIPLGGNRCARWRYYLNLFITFSVSGLWHGANWSFVVWGGLNGLYLILGHATKPVRNTLTERLHIRTDSWSYRLFQMLITFALVDFAWLFFRADSLGTAAAMLRHASAEPGLFSMLEPENVLGLNTLGLPEKDFVVLLLSLVVLFLVDYFRPRVDLKLLLSRQNVVFRYLCYYLLIFAILIFGVYGSEYDAAQFIYFQF